MSNTFSQREKDSLNSLNSYIIINLIMEFHYKYKVTQEGVKLTRSESSSFLFVMEFGEQGKDEVRHQCPHIPPLRVESSKNI
jgi:hypothetical protein